jgi:ATP-binding cassette subfamily B protein
MNGSILLLLWMGGVRVDSGGAKVGDVMAFVTYFQQILQAMTMMSMIFTAGARARTSLSRIGLVFASTGDAPEPDQPGEPPRAGAVEMRSVSYIYDGQSEPALSGIEFRIVAGETAAVIGSTGSGKSTLVHLVQRFHDVSSGCVLVDGQDVRDFAQKELRRRVAIVPQQSILFTGTLRDNLLWGDPDATGSDLARALSVSQAADFVARMPEGLDTRIGQGGVNLSGGQKQRLCIARALIRKPDVLIMDDSTSAVDMETERRLRSALREECEGMTVIVVAQRIHTVMEADTILVLDEGRLVQQGTHEELLRGCPLYRDIYRSQVGLDVAGQEVV